MGSSRYKRSVSQRWVHQSTVYWGPACSAPAFGDLFFSPSRQGSCNQPLYRREGLDPEQICCTRYISGLH